MEITPEVIIHAARQGRADVLEEIIKTGASLDVRDDKGYTPLIIACYNNQYNAAKFLLDHGAEINDYDHGGNTALMGAAFKGYMD
ncbi:MAG: ankyrin repeat domain-containing protein, partial [Daejeonella sp.]|uniref:ankyrin repeat domain-containing protein n=1 Tax=Daejeonella sp. TaxID=2805397 RepID=UPI003C78D67B